MIKLTNELFIVEYEKEEDWIVQRQSLQDLNTQLIKNHDAMLAERKAVRAQAE